MFTTPMFYIGLVIIALLPLRRKSAIKSSLPCVFSLLLSLSYAEKENDFDGWNNGIHIDCGGEY